MGLKTIEVNLPSDSVLIGRSISQIAPHLPKECLVISISRNNATLIPHGDFVLQKGDSLSVLVEENSIPLIQELLGDIKFEEAVE